MSEYYAVQRSTDHLAHYGVKGMKWGVRKAIAYNNQKELDRHFRKAAKKLNKLHNKAYNSGKYLAKAAAYGAAAAGTGAIAVGGTKNVGSMLNKAGAAIQSASKKPIAKKVGSVLDKAGSALTEWGKPRIGYPNKDKIDLYDASTWSNNKSVNLNKNDLYFRLGAGALSAGFGAAAIKNAYVAANGRKYANKADDFRKAMDESFAGTRYEGQYVALPKMRKRKRRY